MLKLLLPITAAAALAAGPAALAKGGDDDVRRQGTCTGSSSVKIKVKPDDGRIEAEVEVDQNRNGVRWRVVIKRDGKRVVRTHATTRGPSGSFSVERKIADTPGTNRIVGRAVSPSGEVCRAVARI